MIQSPALERIIWFRLLVKLGEYVFVNGFDVDNFGEQFKFIKAQFDSWASDPLRSGTKNICRLTIAGWHTFLTNMG